MRCAGPHGHTTWLGVWVGVVSTWGFPWCRAGALGTHFASPTGEPATRRPRRSGCAGVALRLVRTMRASACARGRSAGGASARHERAHIAPPWEEVAGSHAWGRMERAACSRRARFCDAVARRVGRASGGKSSGAHLGHRREPGGGLCGPTCMPRGRGTSPTTRTGCRTPEDHATPPRRSARAQTAPPRRGRRVWRSARFNQKCTTR